MSINLNIELIKGSKNPILSIAESISNGKIFEIKPIDSDLKDKFIEYCNELPFEILSRCDYLSIETMNIISFHIKINRKEILANVTNKSFIIPEEIHFHHNFNDMLVN